MTKHPITPKRTARRIATLLDVAADNDRDSVWEVGVGGLNRWDRWWLIRHLTRMAPHRVTVIPNRIVFVLLDDPGYLVVPYWESKR